MSKRSTAPGGRRAMTSAWQRAEGAPPRAFIPSIHQCIGLLFHHSFGRRLHIRPSRDTEHLSRPTAFAFSPQSTIRLVDCSINQSRDQRARTPFLSSKSYSSGHAYFHHVVLSAATPPQRYCCHGSKGQEAECKIEWRRAGFRSY